MRVDSNFYGSVPMADAGNAGPKPVDRRSGNDDVVACYDNLAHWARTMDTLGMWRDLLGLEHLCCFFDMPGLTREQLDEQLHLFAGEVAPRLGISLDGPAGD